MPDITLSLNENEQQILFQLIDAANRHLGSQAAKAVAIMLDKIVAAQNLAKDLQDKLPPEPATPVAPQ